MIVINILGLTSIVVFYLFMVSPREIGVNLFTVTSLMIKTTTTAAVAAATATAATAAATTTTTTIRSMTAKQILV